MPGCSEWTFWGSKRSLLKDAIENIVLRFGESKRLDPDEIPLDDELTFGLFQHAETNGIFHFESDGMQKHLRDLKPTDIEDLIAMNALYRPGPMDNIPKYVARKHGREPVDVTALLVNVVKPTSGLWYEKTIHAGRSHHRWI